ncbi:Cupredoxin [Microdochium trichocladiopsis]|uniref:Cupredoxin n=1 Tax=Microdochium trichocladiopsis TaxID=1682393 RepID=A0A9P8XXL9_9PEZI|nr:Cupredoxin [Microdochium trichocladiopsis]KAH7024677.1 Cupredoxin [Microdochium trichocladiopsis]
MVAPSLTRLLTLGGSALSLLSWTSQAATVRYDFDIGWVTADPTGEFPRQTIGINGAWPIPPIRAAVGDRVVIHVKNSLGNETTSLHFHGLFMNGTTHMDGPVGVSQCPIAPGGTLTYDFHVTQPGTYWYHSHSRGQYPDGLRGPFIVTDPDIPFAYDDEVVLTLSDWYHEQMATTLIPRFMSKKNPTGAEPVPDAALMNDAASGEVGVRVEPGKTYLVRMVNMGAFASQYVWIEGHEVEIVELDGVYTEPARAEMLYLSAGQRCSFLLRTRKGDVGENFAIVGSMDTTLFDAMPASLNPNVTGHLVYSPAHPLPAASPVSSFTPIDDFTLTPYDRMPLLPPPTRPEHDIELVVKMDNLRDGRNYAFFNNITYTPPKVPTLYTALSAPEDLVRDRRIYGGYTNTFVLEGPRGEPSQKSARHGRDVAAAAAAGGDTVQIVLRNEDDGRHPFHLHGHTFQVLYRSSGEEEDDEDEGEAQTGRAKAWKESEFPAIPVRRDTVVVWGNGEVVLRFRADNPGVWLFHCHIEWHVDSGLIATLVESPLEIRRQLGSLDVSSSSPSSLLAHTSSSLDGESAEDTLQSTTTSSKIPQDHLDACAASGMLARGNAAGNVDDFLNLDGEARQPGPLPDGFTPKGYVALLISTLSGIIGLVTITWYGLAPVDGGRGGDDESRAGTRRRRGPPSSHRGGGGGDNGDAVVGRASEDSVDSVDTVGDDDEGVLADSEGGGGGEQQPLLARSAGDDGHGLGVRRVR